MAYATNTLELAVIGTTKIHTYKTTDAVATVAASGYFNAAAEQLDQFDVILAICSTGGTPTVDTLVVTSADRAATVTTSGTEGITAT